MGEEKEEHVKLVDKAPDEEEERRTIKIDHGPPQEEDGIWRGVLRVRTGPKKWRTKCFEIDTYQRILIYGDSFAGFMRKFVRVTRVERLDPKSKTFAVYIEYRDTISSYETKEVGIAQKIKRDTFGKVLMGSAASKTIPRLEEERLILKAKTPDDAQAWIDVFKSIEGDDFQTARARGDTEESLHGTEEDPKTGMGGLRVFGSVRERAQQAVEAALTAMNGDEQEDENARDKEEGDTKD